MRSCDRCHKFEPRVTFHMDSSKCKSCYEENLEKIINKRTSPLERERKRVFARAWHKKRREQQFGKAGV